MSLIDAVLTARGLTREDQRMAFLNPSYELYKHDPFMLPDMEKAVTRLEQALKNKDKVVIYGDYDIDGLTAGSLLYESFSKFGISTSVFIPNRFVEGYGLSSKAIEKIASEGARLIVTVDCGSLSFDEIARANELGVDVIVTDHHSTAETMPSAVAVINPKRLADDYPDNYKNYRLIQNDQTPTGLYPFLDLAGVGVAFKLVQAMQTRLEGIPQGQEKWLLDLVALGTVCDIVTLVDENRANVYWGLEVMKKTRRPGLKLLMSVSKIIPEKLTSRSLGFVLGPRLNASGRLETAQISLDLLMTDDNVRARELAELLEAMNVERRVEQNRIYKEALEQADQRSKDSILIVSDTSWSHGIIGIVASKLLERYHKPTFVLQEMEDGTAKGSARSFGDFSAVSAIRATEEHLIKGGGHKFAAGVTLQTTKIDSWRRAMNEYHRGLKLVDQMIYMEVKSDVTLSDFSLCTDGNVSMLGLLEPFGNGNPEPVFQFTNLTIIGRRTMGSEDQHVKYRFADIDGQTIEMIAFNKADEFVLDIGENVSAWCELSINEWNNRRSVEGRLLKLKLSES